MNPLINIVGALILMVVLLSCTKKHETTKQPTPRSKNISPFLTKSAKEYSPMINAIVDHIDDTLVFQCQGTTRFIPNLDSFKLKHVDSIALGIGKNVYFDFTGYNSSQYLHVPNGPPVNIAELGNLYFYIYTDFYQAEPDSSYSIINLRFLYNLTEPPFR
jgi:hypothetical protein